MATRVGEMFISLAIDAASGNLSVKELIGSLGELEVTSLGSAAILGKIAQVLWDMGKAAVGAAVDLNELAVTTGVETDLANRWDKAAQVITGKSGVIVAAIRHVSEMNNAFMTGRGQMPQSLGALGIDIGTGKTDKSGREILKTGIDLMEALNANKAYQELSRGEKQERLKDIFAGDTGGIFMIMNAMRDKTFRPQDIPGFDKKQVSELTKVSQDFTKIGLEATGVFQKIMVGGGSVDRAMKGTEARVRQMNKWMGTDDGQNTIGGFMELTKGIIKTKMGGISGASANFDRFAAANVRLSTPTASKQSVEGKVEVTLKDSKGNIHDRKTAHLDQTLTNHNVDRAADAIGNSGGQ